MSSANFAFNTQGSGAIPGLPDSPQKAGTYTGVIAPKGLPDNPAATGTYSGVLNTPKTTATPVTPTTPANPNVANINSQLSDLQNLQKAMTQYGTTDSSQLVKNADGSYAPKAPTLPAPVASNNPTPVNTNAPVYNQSVQNLNNIGQGTANNPTVQSANAGLLNIPAQVQSIASDYGAKISDVGRQGANAQSGFKSTGTTPVAVGNSGIIAENTAAQQNALAQGEQAALQGAGYSTTALSAAAGSGNTQQGQNIGASENAGTLSKPVQSPYLLDPTTGKIIGGGGNINSALTNASNYDLVGQFNQKYQQGIANLSASDGIKNQIIGTLTSNPDLNSNSLTFLTNINQLLSGQTGSPAQQLLAQQISNYLGQLGLDTGSAITIATQQKGTLAQLLDSLRQTAQTQVDAYNPANINLGGSSNSGINDVLGIFK